MTCGFISNSQRSLRLGAIHRLVYTNRLISTQHEGSAGSLQAWVKLTKWVSSATKVFKQFRTHGYKYIEIILGVYRYKPSPSSSNGSGSVGLHKPSILTNNVQFICHRHQITEHLINSTNNNRENNAQFIKWFQTSPPACAGHAPTERQPK